MPHLDVPGATLHGEADGHASTPALLLVHAGIADLRRWDPRTGWCSAPPRICRRVERPEELLRVLRPWLVERGL